MVVTAMLRLILAVRPVRGRESDLPQNRDWEPIPFGCVYPTENFLTRFACLPPSNFVSSHTWTIFSANSGVTHLDERQNIGVIMLTRELRHLLGEGVCATDFWKLVDHHVHTVAGPATVIPRSDS